MMHLVGNIEEYKNTTDGLKVTLLVDDVQLDELESIKDKELSIDLKELKGKRSLNANAYFWKLVSMIANALGSDKDTIYIQLLKRYGQFVNLDIIADTEAIAVLKKQFACLEVIEEYEVFNGRENFIMQSMNCYFGSSAYCTDEFAHLLSGTISEAAELHIPTITPKELEILKQNWRMK